MPQDYKKKRKKVKRIAFATIEIRRRAEKEKFLTGFTLIELLIVVIIMGFLASMAIPNFNKTMRKSREKQARAMLELAYDAQRMYRIDKGLYFGVGMGVTADFGGQEGLGLYIDDPNDRSSHYAYTIENVAQGPDRFQIRAKYSRDNTTLMIDQTGTIVKE